MPLGVIFDWDGVILDSHAAHKRAWERLAAKLGKPIPENHMELGFGKRNETIIPEILHWADDPAEIARLGNEKEELYREVLASTGITPLPGVVPFLQRLKDAGIPCAIGTSTSRLNVEVALEAMGLGAYFAAMSCAEDVTRGKPAPDVFLLAAERIGRAPQDCVVFEDAPFGLEAAKTGGMAAVGVLSSHPAEHLPLADRHVNRLDELSLDDLHALIARN
jgi:beta-phosphoglucomutase family hydrolase